MKGALAVAVAFTFIAVACGHGDPIFGNGLSDEVNEWCGWNVEAVEAMADAYLNAHPDEYDGDDATVVSDWTLVQTDDRRIYPGTYDYADACGDAYKQRGSAGGSVATAPDPDRFCEMLAGLEEAPSYYVLSDVPDEERLTASEAKAFLDEFVEAAPTEIHSWVETISAVEREAIELFEAAGFDIEAVDFVELEALFTAELETAGSAMDEWVAATCPWGALGPSGGDDSASTTTFATTATANAPGEADAFVGAGVAEEALGNTEAAIEAYRRAGEIDPDNPEYADLLGAALLSTAPSSAVPTATPVEMWPEALAVTPDAVWVSNAGSRSVSQLDRANLNPLGASSVGRLPGDLEVTPDGSVWVLARTDSTIWRIDPDTGDATSEVELPDCPESMTRVPSGALAVVLWEDCSSVNSSVVVVDPQTGELTESAHLGLEAAGEILFAKDKLYVVAGVGLDMPRRGLRAYFHRLDDSIPEATEIVGPVLDLLSGEAVRSIVTDGQHVFVDVSNGDGTDIYRFALNGETLVRLATLDAPAVTMTATDRFLIAVGDDGSVSFVVTEVAGFAVTLDMGIGPLELLGETTLADERLLFTHFSEDGAGVIVAVDLN